MSSDAKISNPRAEIDNIDDEILRLLNERATIALRVGAVKTDRDASLCDTHREREVLERLTNDNTGPFDGQSIANIFQRIIDESLYLQQKTYCQPSKSSEETKDKIELSEEKSRIAFLDECGTLSETVALGVLGENCSVVLFPTLEELFKAIDAKRTDYILIPLENSLTGSVHRSYDMLLQSSLSIVAEIILQVSHFLIASPQTTFETIKTVELHPVALRQCERFFAAHSFIKCLSIHDTKGSVKSVIESGDVTRAVIGSKHEAEIYGGKILRDHIEDYTENYTRFVLLASQAEDKGNGMKISLVIRLNNKPGALHSALRGFVRRGINLLKIESHPIKNVPSQINFYLDLEAPMSESELKGALDEIRELAVDVRFLGRYSTIAVSGEETANATVIL